MVSRKLNLFILAVVFCLTFKVDLVMSSKEVMKSLTSGFAKAFTECNKELNLPDRVTKDLYFFWGEEYELVNKELGCAIKCMAGKFDMITEDSQLHHGNTHEFAKKHGADDEMAKQLVTILHECEKGTTSVADECERVLEIAKCFRTKIHGMKWAPTMEIVLEEVMSEV